MAKQAHPYVRDKRSPKPTSETVSRVMRANKSKDTKPELLLRRALWAAGLRGYRLHKKSLPGRPDIAYTTKKVAIFVNGCFWHRCPHCQLNLPKTNTEFWKAKFARNVQRDQEKQAALIAAGWQLLVIWECKLKKDVPHHVEAIRKLLKDVKGYDIEQEEWLEAAEEDPAYGVE